MGKIEKRIEKWKNPRFKQNVPVGDLFAVLDKYFPESYDMVENAVHILSEFGINYFLTNPDMELKEISLIPTTGGKHVKHFYLKDLVKAIDIITKVEK
ncbi:MAG TPA: hypothetical protein ENI76_02240 [Ignavibacteria bacterium]|nr:hypothetical protein [Ignavibacteria bacterium]